jgi:hypothetical protein
MEFVKLLMVEKQLYYQKKFFLINKPPVIYDGEDVCVGCCIFCIVAPEYTADETPLQRIIPDETGEVFCIVFHSLQFAVGCI